MNRQSSRKSTDQLVDSTTSRSGVFRTLIVRASPRSVAAGAALVVVLLGSTACATTSSVSAIRVAPTVVPAALPTPAAGPNGESLTLQVVDNGEHVVITNSDGRPVYGNSRDRDDALFCVGECTESWIPLVQTAALISAELDVTKYRLIQRPDGTEQVVYNDIALYTWTGDSDVGLPLGTGVAGIWFAVSVDGERIN